MVPVMFTPNEWIILTSVTFLAFSYWRYRKAVGMVSNFPGLRLLVSPMSPLGLLLPSLPFPFFTYPGFSFPWELKHAGLFAKLKCDTISLCAFDGRALLFTADVSFITRMSAFVSRELFPKPVEEYKVLSYLGNNLVICEGDSWRRQRRIGAPAFSKGMFERLWLDMRDIVREMVEQERWFERTSPDYHPLSSSANAAYKDYTLKSGEVLAPHVVDLTLRMALAAIARAGFGMDFEWEAEESFTRVCQSFGNPVRPKIWLSFLSAVWTGFDILVGFFYPLIVFYRPLVQLVEESFIWRFFLTLSPIVWSVWSSTMMTPVRIPVHILWVLVAYFTTELWAVFARPTQADWNPRKIKIHEALHLVAKDSTLRIAIPTWMMKLPFRRMRRMRLAFSTLEAELKRLAEERKMFHLRNSLDEVYLKGNESIEGNELIKAGERSDLLNNLVKAALLDEGDLEKGPVKGLVSGAIQKGLTDEEIIGNTYIYFLAGHETTAHSLAWTLALLAAYPEYQQQAVEEIDSVWPSSSNADDTPNTFEPFHSSTTMDDYAKFPFVLACYSETLRLFPPVQMIPKVAAQDTIISVGASNVAYTEGGARPVTTPIATPTTAGGSLSDAAGAGIGIDTQTSFAIKKGTVIFVDPPGVHYNPKYWEDPNKFDPNRFLRPYCKDAFIPFGVGHRACLGRKFSEVESVAMLAHLLRNYSVHLVPDSPDGSVNVEAARERFSKASVRITLTPAEVPLIFRRRVRV